MDLMNYCATYFTFVKTEIRLLNFVMQNEAKDEENILFFIKQIVNNHRTAIG